MDRPREAEYTVSASNARALMHNAVVILVYGHDVGDDALRREGQVALAHLLQE
jgi:hypothetical protein